MRVGLYTVINNHYDNFRHQQTGNAAANGKPKPTFDGSGKELEGDKSLDVRVQPPRTQCIARTPAICKAYQAIPPLWRTPYRG